MKTALECIPCFARQATEAVLLSETDPLRRAELLRNLLLEIARSGWQGSPPAMAQRLHRVIRRELNCNDPYRELKSDMNETAARLLPSLRDAMERQPDPREAAVRLAIGGNLLDAGAKTQIAPDDLSRHMDCIWTKPLHGNPAALFQAAESAHCILYLADNAGEIFFDRVLIEALPAEKITVFVRGAPVLNDATLDDAEKAGLPEIAPVFSNGSDAPGTLLEDCSAEFQSWFERADLIIAKGQGNFETLSETDKPTFFLLTVKCPRVAQQTGAPIGALVVCQGGSWE